MIGVSSNKEDYVLLGLNQNNFIIICCFIYLYIFIYNKIINKDREVMANTKLTTVKIIKDVYSKFKKISFDSNITLQKLVNRSLDKYIEDETFQNEINTYGGLQSSGSQF